VRVNSAQGGYKMIFECMNGMLSCISPMLAGGYALKRHMVLEKNVLQVLRAFVVDDIRLLQFSLFSKY
jgi:hypothetical protein